MAADVYRALSRPYSLPPGTPADRVKTLQKAFMDTLKDPELVANAKKSKVELNPYDGNWVAKKMQGLYDMTPPRCRCCRRPCCRRSSYASRLEETVSRRAQA